MVALWWYVGVGSLNAVAAGAQRGLVLNHERSLEAWVEVAFYVLLWPIQALFWTLVLIYRTLGFILSKVLP